MHAQPAPFEIVEADGTRVASNGAASLTILADLAGQGRLFRRRAQKGLNVKPAGEIAVPMLNQLCGELVANLSMPGDQVVARIRAIAEAVQPEPPKNVEWAVAEIDGLRVYSDGRDVIVTRADITP